MGKDRKLKFMSEKHKNKSIPEIENIWPEV